MVLGAWEPCGLIVKSFWKPPSTIPMGFAAVPCWLTWDSCYLWLLFHFSWLHSFQCGYSNGIQISFLKYMPVLHRPSSLCPPQFSKLRSHNIFPLVVACSCPLLPSDNFELKMFLLCSWFLPPGQCFPLEFYFLYGNSPSGGRSYCLCCFRKAGRVFGFTHSS